MTERRTGVNEGMFEGNTGRGALGPLLRITAGALAMAVVVACGGSAMEPGQSPTPPSGMFSTLPTTEPPVVGDQPPTIELNTAEPTYTPQPTPTPNPTYTPEPTPTPLPTPTSNPTGTPLPTPVPTPDPTATPQPTYTPLPTYTPVPLATATPYPTSTPYPTVTRIPMATPKPRDTSHAGASFACSEGADTTPLHLAVYETNLDVVRILADLCPEDLNAVSDKSPYRGTPLSLAIGKAPKEIVQALLEAGADPNFRTLLRSSYSFGKAGTHLTYAILLYAIGYGDIEIVQILLDADTDPNVIDTKLFGYDQTPLSIAIRKADQELMRMLIAAGADPNKNVKCGFSVGTHLTYAVVFGDAEVVQILLDAGADPNVIDGDTTPLVKAVYKRDAEMVRMLVDAGADPNLKPDQRDDDTPLTIAISLGYTEIVKILTGSTN